MNENQKNSHLTASSAGGQRRHPLQQRSITTAQQKSSDKQENAKHRSAGNPPNEAQKIRSIYLQRNDVKEFHQIYQLMVNEAQRIEASSKDINEIASVNYRIYLFMNSFLDKVRKNVQSQLIGDNDPAKALGDHRVLVTLRDLSSLELESLQRLMRAIVARNAVTTGIGDTLIASVSQKNLVDELRHSLTALDEQEGNEGNNDDDTAEERDPMSVNLSNSKGLYSILDTSEAFLVNDLIGYKNEARELLAYCRDVQFIDSSNPTAIAANRNPICVVLYGPPGSGKTTIAQAVARQLDYIYMYVNAENVVSSWAGGTEKNIAKLFRRARIASKQHAGRRVLMLIDEIDGLLKNRATAVNITGEEYNRITTFLQMLTPPVGVNNSAIVALFTTNLLQNIDSAVINRCRGRLFMGYIVEPQDRFALMQRVFSRYLDIGTLPADPFAQLADTEDHLVPRDYQNLVAQIQNRILQKYEKKQATQDKNQHNLQIDLSQKDILINSDELKDIISRAEPATRANSYLLQFKPPHAHICAWLNANPRHAGSYGIFSQYAEQERLDCR